MNKKVWLEKLFKSHEIALLGYTKSLVKDLEVARDVVQETFLRAWKAGPSKLKGYERAWLFRVARNQSVDYFRRGKKTDPLDHEFDIESPTTSVLRSMELKEGLKWLESALLTLNSKQKEVMSLKYQGDLNYKEIAAVMGVKENYVGVLLHGAMKSLQQLKSDESGESNFGSSEKEGGQNSKTNKSRVQRIASGTSGGEDG